MRHEISKSEAAAIHKDRAQQAKVARERRAKEELARWDGEQEIRGKTQ